jgi:predicted GIY-YIG superfamily endonuclease
MPKVPMDYSKCCIYTIKHVDDDRLVYVGHTTNFDKRIAQHKINYNDKRNAFNLKVYQMIREHGGWDAFKMIEVEKYPCNDKREAERRENEIMKESKASMNMITSYRTEEEVSEDKQEYKKEYYEAHKEKSKEYREINKEKIQEYKNVS